MREADIRDDHGLSYWEAYPEAACKPSPREPPVTTTTFPLREKMLGKSWSSVSYFDISAEIRLIEYIESRIE